MERNLKVSSLLTAGADSRNPEDYHRIGRAVAAGGPEQVAFNILSLSRALYRFQEASSTGKVHDTARPDSNIAVPLDPTLIGLLRAVSEKPERARSRVLEEIERQASEAYLERMREVSERIKSHRGQESEIKAAEQRWREFGTENRAVRLAVRSAISGSLRLYDGHFPIYGFGSQT